MVSPVLVWYTRGMSQTNPEHATLRAIARSYAYGRLDEAGGLHPNYFTLAAEFADDYVDCHDERPVLRLAWNEFMGRDEQNSVERQAARLLEVAGPWRWAPKSERTR